MKKLLFVVGMTMLIAACTTPLRINTTDSSGAVHEIEVRDSKGEVVEVGNDLKNKIEAAKPAIENEIKTALQNKVKEGNFKKEYAISIDSIVSKNVSEPLSEEEKAVFRAIGEALAREYVKQIVYPAWAKKIVGAVLPSAKERLAVGDYTGAREVIWGMEKSDVADVDNLACRLGNRFLGKEVNPAQWLLLEKELLARSSELISAKQYDGARKAINEFAEIRTYAKTLTEAPAPTAEETEDTMKVVDGKASGTLGTSAVNVRISKLKEKLLADVVAAEKAELDDKMQKMMDELIAKVISLVEAGSFDEARDTIRDVALVNSAEWDAKIYAVRIGLMNSVVNPNQLKHLKAEAAKTIDELVAQKKYAEAIKYIDEYQYVHDTFAQIKESFGRIEDAMRGLKLDDDKSSEYVASQLAEIRELMEKRLGRYNSNEDYSELEKALGELEKGYIAQHYDNVAANGVTNSIKSDIVAMVYAKYAPLTTWEMNEALRRFLVSKRPKLPADTVDAATAPVLGVISEEVDYDAQIAMAEAAIADPAAVYGLEAVLGDYARIMRRCKAGNPVEPDEATTMLLASVFLNQPEMFKLALTLKADVNAAARRDDLVRAPILLAVQLGRIEFVKLIQNADGKYDVADANGNTLLHYAAERGNLAVLRAAAQAVKIDCVNKSGETVLFVAVRRNQLAVVDAILQLVGDSDAQKKFVAIANGAGATAFDVACTSNAHMLLDSLVAAGAKYDEKNLAAALSSDCIGVAQWLVEKGLDVNADVVRSTTEDPTKMGKGATRAYLISEGFKPSVKSAGGTGTEGTK